MPSRLPKLLPNKLTGDLRKGGWLMDGIIDGDTDAVSYGRNWRLMGKSGATFMDATWREIFNGHILVDPDEYEFDRFTSRIRIQAGTMNEFLEGESLQDIGFTSQASPANDHQIVTMNLGEIVDHIIRRHCNAVYNATTMPDGVVTELDIDTTNSTTLSRYNVYKSSNLWRSLQEIGGGDQSGEFYSCWFDRHNKFYYQPTPAFWTTPPTSKGNITKDHLRGQVRVKLNNNKPHDKIGQVQLTGYSSYDTFYNASWPANPARGKTLPPKDGIWTNSQARADTLAERLYKWLTRAYTVELEVDPGLILFGDDGDGLDLADKVTFDYNGPAEDSASGAGVHLNFSMQSFFVYGASIDFDAVGKMARGVLLLEQDPT